MTVEMYLIITLIFIIIGAIIAVETKNLLSSIISVGVIGLGLSIAFLFLQAPDLTIVQIPVEIILLIILLRATVKVDIESTGKHINWFGISIIFLLLIFFVIFGYFAFQNLELGKPVITSIENAPANFYLKNGLKDTGSSNIVTSIILDYRAYDTIGEATVLFTSIIGALAILRGIAKKKKEEKK